MLYNFVMEESSLSFHPLTSERWQDFETLFGKNGACAGCWCMYWYQTHTEFIHSQYEPNRLAMKALVESGEIPGLMAYQGETPVGWVSVAPREKYASLQRSRVLAPIDDQSVWSIVCYYIPAKHRKKGLMVYLTQIAKDYARSKGAHLLEAYPMDKETRLSSLSAYMGVKSVLEKAGFKEVLRRSPNHPILRCTV
jgi:hypothetical protein